MLETGSSVRCSVPRVDFLGSRCPQPDRAASGLTSPDTAPNIPLAAHKQDTHSPALRAPI